MSTTNFRVECEVTILYTLTFQISILNLDQILNSAGCEQATTTIVTTKCRQYRFTVHPVQIYSTPSTDLQCTQYRFTVHPVQIYSTPNTDLQYTQYRFTVHPVQVYSTPIFIITRLTRKYWYNICSNVSFMSCELLKYGTNVNKRLFKLNSF
jgi:hypothetical protein